jgi:phage baseplate assembly protein V
MNAVLKNLARVGRVSSINPANATVRVVFEDRENMVSYDLPVIVRQSMRNKDYWLPDVGEQVLCLFLPSGNAQGFVLGAFYSDEDLPPVNDANKRHVRFDDGTSVEYDRKSHRLSIRCKGDIDIEAQGNIRLAGGRIDFN